MPELDGQIDGGLAVGSVERAILRRGAGRPHVDMEGIFNGCYRRLDVTFRRLREVPTTMRPFAFAKWMTAS